MKMKPISQIKADLGINPGGRIQKFFSFSCRKHMDKYIPMDTGNLADTWDMGADYITYEQPYAHYQYIGISKSGKPLNYSTEKHPYAGSYWDKRMVSAEMQDVVKEVQDEVRKHGNR